MMLVEQSDIVRNCLEIVKNAMSKSCTSMETAQSWREGGFHAINHENFLGILEKRWNQHKKFLQVLPILEKYYMLYMYMNYLHFYQLYLQPLLSSPICSEPAG